jgi:hypothetical protein
MLSTHGEKVILLAMATGLLGMLVIGFAVLGAPVAMLLFPVLLILLSFMAVRGDVAHVRRFGWSVAGDTDDPSPGGGPDGPQQPGPVDPTGSGEQFDWDAFVIQFWEHVDRQPVA